MSDELLRYYNSELAFLRKMGNEFAEAHSAVAGYLRLGSEAEYDPHVGRMVQAFAYLNARTRRKLEDDFPEVSSSLLEVLYPHYLRPIPSTAIVRFSLDRSQADMTGGYQLPRGTLLESLPIEGEPCRFRTTYPVTCWPIRLSQCSLKGMPFTAPQTSFSSTSAAVLQMTLSSFSEEIPLAKVEAQKLQFYIRAQAPFNFDLYELLMNNVSGIALARKATDEHPTILPIESIEPVGFSRDESLLDYPQRSFGGYRLLSEYFAFPEKFLFFNIDLGTHLASFESGPAELYIYLNESVGDLESQVGVETLELGCTPIVNMFKHKAEPIRLTHFKTEYRVIPDSRRPRAFEVYSVDNVTATTRDNRKIHYEPFYSFHHPGGDGQRSYWHAKREWSPGKQDASDGGTEVFLTFCDLDFDPAEPEKVSIDVETTCINRDLPSRLPFGGGQPQLQIEGGGAVSKVTCLTKPTETIRPPLGQGTRWRLISQLSLNHLSLADAADGAEALREILRLYDFRDSAETRKTISGLQKVSTQPTVGRVDSPVSGGMCRGLQVSLHFDEDHYTGGGLFLFASVLDRFLGLYANLNSFAQTVVTTNKREGELRRWPPRAGEQVLL